MLDTHAETGRTGRLSDLLREGFPNVQRRPRPGRRGPVVALGNRVVIFADALHFPAPEGQLIVAQQFIAGFRNDTIAASPVGTTEGVNSRGSPCRRG